MKRLAFFSPVPPAATGIADYAADVLRLLAGRYEIDVFHGQPEVDPPGLPAGVGAYAAATFAARQAERPYGLPIHQLGNAPAHDFVYPALVRAPGLLVLHDLVLHHSRARMFLDGPEARAYARDPGRADAQAAAARVRQLYEDEVRYAYPATGARVAAAQLGTVGDLLPYAYPLFRLPVESSRLVAVHNAFMAAAVRAEVPEAEVVRIPMPIEPMPVDPARVRALRGRYGIGEADFVVGTFGLVTREKRIDTVARAVARLSAARPGVRLLVVGPVADRARLEARLDALGVARGAIVTGRVPFDELAAHMELADAVVHLRYPTARETSAALLRVLAQGRPTVMSDLEHLADVDGSAVVRADVADEEGEVTRGLLRLAEAPILRTRLGAAARAFIAREHAPARAAAAYVEAIERAMSLPAPRPRADWPAHWAAS